MSERGHTLRRYRTDRGAPEGALQTPFLYYHMKHFRVPPVCCSAEWVCEGVDDIISNNKATLPWGTRVQMEDSLIMASCILRHLSFQCLSKLSVLCSFLSAYICSNYKPCAVLSCLEIYFLWHAGFFPIHFICVIAGCPEQRSSTGTKIE